MDNSWLCHVECVRKKGGMNMAPNEMNELVQMQIVKGWRVFIDFRKLNAFTEKDHFPTILMFQMLDPLIGKGLYLLLLW